MGHIREFEEKLFYRYEKSDNITLFEGTCIFSLPTCEKAFETS
jgi:hypothetical protein